MKLSRSMRAISRRLFAAKKRASHVFKPYAEHKTILFLVGCQRSGTTLALQIFENDPATKTFGEFSMLSSHDEHGIRLNSLPLVERDIRRFRPSLVVLKPLVESQNVLSLLEYFDGSKALWIYRDYRDVASSNLNRFGICNGINNLRPIVANESGNWRSERVPEAIRAAIVSQFSETMNPYDAAVLFWCARNSLYFELGLAQHPGVMLCRYEDLITNPTQVVEAIYSNLGCDYPGPKIHREIHSGSLKKGEDIQLSPEVDALAKGMLEELDKVYQTSKLQPSY